MNKIMSRSRSIDCVIIGSALGLIGYEIDRRYIHNVGYLNDKLRDLGIKRDDCFREFDRDAPVCQKYQKQYKEQTAAYRKAVKDQF